MKSKTQNPELDSLTDAIVRFTIESNVDLITAENNEQFETCDFVLTAMYMGFNYYTDVVCKLNPEFNRTYIFDGIVRNSHQTFELMKRSDLSS